MDNGQLRNLHTRDLCRCPIQLRTVRKETVDYYMLRDSIRDVGIIQPLLVRPKDGRHEVVCGSHRLECAIDLRIEEVSCVIREMSDREVLRIQVVENSNRILTNPVDYVRRLQKIVNAGEMSVAELASYIHRHPDWVRRLLSLNCLSEKCKQSLDDEEISVTLAIELAKLPIRYQEELLHLSAELPASESLEMVRTCVREMRTGKGRSREAEIGPILRKYRSIHDEYLNQTNAATMLMRAGAVTALDGWIAHSEWVLCMDAQMVEERVARRRRAEHLEAKRTELRNLEMKARKAHEQ